MDTYANRHSGMAPTPRVWATQGSSICATTVHRPLQYADAASMSSPDCRAIAGPRPGSDQWSSGDTSNGFTMARLNETSHSRRLLHVLLGCLDGSVSQNGVNDEMLNASSLTGSRAFLAARQSLQCVQARGRLPSLPPRVSASLHQSPHRK